MSRLRSGEAKSARLVNDGGMSAVPASRPELADPAVYQMLVSVA